VEKKRKEGLYVEEDSEKRKRDEVQKRPKV
jgi:hypothetical protein